MKLLATYLLTALFAVSFAHDSDYFSFDCDDKVPPLYVNLLNNLAGIISLLESMELKRLPNVVPPVPVPEPLTENETSRQSAEEPGKPIHIMPVEGKPIQELPKPILVMPVNESKPLQPVQELPIPTLPIPKPEIVPLPIPTLPIPKPEIGPLPEPALPIAKPEIAALLNSTLPIPNPEIPPLPQLTLPIPKPEIAPVPKPVPETIPIPAIADQVVKPIIPSTKETPADQVKPVELNATTILAAPKMSISKRSINDTTGPVNETVVTPVNQTVVEPVNQTVVLPANHTIVKPHGETAIAPLNDSLTIEEIRFVKTEMVRLYEALIPLNDIINKSMAVLKTFVKDLTAFFDPRVIAMERSVFCPLEVILEKTFKQLIHSNHHLKPRHFYKRPFYTLGLIAANLKAGLMLAKDDFDQFALYVLTDRTYGFQPLVKRIRSIVRHATHWRRHHHFRRPHHEPIRAFFRTIVA